MKIHVVTETFDRSAGLRADPGEAARYIATFTGELSSLAKHSGLDLLGYLLDMARLEAEKQHEENSRPAQSLIR